MYITSSLTQIQLLRLHGGLEGTLLTREIPLRTLLRKNKNKQRRFTETYSFGRQPSGAPIPTIKLVRYNAGCVTGCFLPIPAKRIARDVRQDADKTRVCSLAGVRDSGGGRRDLLQIGAPSLHV